jgi:predicted HicB family RNase H-like nuclease
MAILKAGRPTNRKEKILAAVREKEERTTRLNMNIPKSFHKKLKQRALDENITVNELAMKALSKYIGE